jgi:elongation factor G
MFSLPATGEGRFIRQQGPPGRYAHVQLVVEECQLVGVSIAWEVKPEQIPSMFEPAVRKGILDWNEHARVLDLSARRGLLVRVVGGSHHEIDSNETSFVTAAALALKDAVEGAAKK